ncbi:MAG: hypothetical protein GXP28_01845 [Planctomycetes bacterium]|nr:hypothetical protein [Planctomycetota bacterium]
MANEPLHIRVAPSDATSRAAKRHRSRFPVLVGLGLTVALAAGIFFFARLRDPILNENGPQEVSPPTVVTTPANRELEVPELESPKEKVGRELTVEDDGKLLWVSPTVGPPLSLRYVPLGTQLLLHLRPADLLAHAEGKKIRAALGPWGEQAIAKIEEFTGAQLDEIRTLLVCIHPEESGELGCTLRCEMLEAWDDRRLAERLPQSSEATQGGQSYFVANDRACFFPQGDVGKTLVSCPLASAMELIEAGTDPPPLARDLERLLQLSDQQRDLTLVFPTKFLQTSGSNLLRATAKDLHWALQELLADDAAVVAWSAHWGDDFFLELQSTIEFGRQPRAFATVVRKRMSEAHDTLAKTVLAKPLPSYGQKVIERLPEMLRQVSLATRNGEEKGVSTMRCYLPLAAGHNLLMAAELTLNLRTLASRDAPDPNSKPTTVAAKLQKITSLSFTKETFERALEILSEDIGVAIKLRGSDLQLEGITKNQSFGIDLQDLPAGEILLGVLQRANPDRSASGPADPKQKIVYGVREASVDQPGVIVVTTRAAVSERDIKLPAVFEPAPR